jgi:hypothetical protein
MSTSGNAPCSSWTGLLNTSLDYIADRKMDAPGWRPMIDGMLDYAEKNGDTKALISVASMVQEKIVDLGEVTYASWLQDTVGALTAVDKDWAISLSNVGCPILTTNYDSLIEQATDRPSATWQNVTEIQKVLANNSSSVGHLHGLWSEPASVILSDADYARLLGSPAAQELQRAASAIKSLVYVGVGAGLTDPNFSRLIDWHRQMFSSSQLRHYRLCRSSEVADLIVEHRSDHIEPISYGDLYTDLPNFLKSISPTPASPVLLSSTGQVLDATQLAKDALADQIRMDSILCENSADRDSRGVDKLLVPPVLFPVSNNRIQAAEHLADKKKIKRSDSHAISRLNGVTVIVGEENAGLTTTLQWLLDQAASVNASPPILVDFKKFSKGGKPLILQLRTQARALNLLPPGVDQLEDAVVGIDNVTPYAGRLCDQMIGDLLRIKPRQVFIGCRLENEPELVERLVSAGLAPEVRYIGNFNTQDVVKLVSLATPVRPEAVAERVMAVLANQNLPRTVALRGWWGIEFVSLKTRGPVALLG